MLERPLDFWDSWSITLNLTVLERGLHCEEKEASEPALTNGHDVSFLHIEAGGAVSRDVAMSLFVTANQHKLEIHTVCTS